MSEDGGASIETRRATNATRATTVVVSRATTTKDETFVFLQNVRHLAAQLTPHPQLPSLFGFSAIANELLIISST